MDPDDPRVYSDDAHEMDWSEYLKMVEKDRAEARRNGWNLFWFAAYLVAAIVAIAGFMTLLGGWA